MDFFVVRIWSPLSVAAQEHLRRAVLSVVLACLMTSCDITRMNDGANIKIIKSEATRAKEAEGPPSHLPGEYVLRVNYDPSPDSGSASKRR